MEVGTPNFVVAIRNTHWARGDPQIDLVQVLVFPRIKIQPEDIDRGEQKSWIY